MTIVNFDDVLTTGGSGMVGEYVDFGLKPKRSELDITDESQVREYVHAHKPSTILHLAAAADMALCESEPEYAYNINVRGTYNLALAASEIGAKMVFVSSSRVFQGDKKNPYLESDEPNPLTQYGRTKHIAEMIVKQLVSQHVVVRTAWVFGGGSAKDNKFYGAVMKQLQSDTEEMFALNDVSGSPTYGKDFIEEVKKLLEDDVKGTFHITNSGTATRYEIAKMMADIVNPKVKVTAVDRSYFPGASSLPNNESVVSERCVLRPWRDALIEYINEEWSK